MWTPGESDPGLFYIYETLWYLIYVWIQQVYKVLQHQGNWLTWQDSKSGTFWLRVWQSGLDLTQSGWGVVAHMGAVFVRSTEDTLEEEDEEEEEEAKFSPGAAAAAAD